MKHIALLSCVKTKRDYPTQARDLYQSALFKKSLAYAESLEADEILVLSAEHGLTGLDEALAPYEKTLNRMPVAERREWSADVLKRLGDRFDLEDDHFTVLAGLRYREHLLPHLAHHTVPMAGLQFGEQLQFLKRALVDGSDVCALLHHFAWNLPIHRHPIDRDLVPRNGIYVVFEEGESGHGGKRIVRIGTHTGKNQLRSRLRQHFIQENKDRSIFRKNIGRALLASANDPFLEMWDWDLTSRAAREKYAGRVDIGYQAQLEERVTDYIQTNFRVALLEVGTKEDRLRLESKLVSTVSLCEVCGPSDTWLGHHSPKAKIRESGLWQVNELYKTPLTAPDMARLKGRPT